MSKLAENYKKVKPAVVAIVSRTSQNPHFPPIIGTGYIVREDGIIFTNRHVIEACESLPKLPHLPDECPAMVLLFHNTPQGTALVPLPIQSVSFPQITGHGPQDVQIAPDLGIIRVDVNGLPTVKIADAFTLEEGDIVASCGFPMGTDVLQAPGWIHQIAPTLQTGIISAILPMVCDKPHAIMIDILTEGGASGSPIFDPNTGDVIAMLFGGINAPNYTQCQNGEVIKFDQRTAHTLCIPGRFLRRALERVDTFPEFKDHPIEFRQLSELLKMEAKVIRPGEHFFK
jgi:S1-C subfamily serine protease